MTPHDDLPRSPLALRGVLACLMVICGHTAVAQEPLPSWQSIAPPGNLYFNFSDGRLNVRTGPGLDQPVVDTLAVGAVASVQICMPDASWCVIQYGAGRRIGWVETENLTMIDENAQTEPSIEDLRTTAIRRSLEKIRPEPRPER